MTAKLNCIIIEDEPLAQELIEKFIKRIPSLEYKAVFDNAIEALEQIEELNPDIIFLDISMPEMSGMEFVRSFSKNCPNIIFTTAHHEFALEAFEHDAIDYLLKPIAFDRFVKAINKAKARLNPSLGINSNTTSQIAEYQIGNNTNYSTISLKEEDENELIDEGMIRDNFLWVKEDRKLVKIDFNEIVYIEGMKDYLKIFLLKSMVITHMTMEKMEKVLSLRKLFLRINRSYIINTKFMIALDGNMIELENNKKLMIGTTYRDIIKNAMKVQLP